MEDRRFGASLSSKIKNIFSTTVTIGFLASLIIMWLGGSFYVCYVFFQLAFAVSVIGEAIRAVTFKLTRNGISVNSALRHEMFLFDKYNILRAGSKGKYSLHFVSKDGKRSVHIACRSFSTAEFERLMSNIKLYRGSEPTYENEPTPENRTVIAKPAKPPVESGKAETPPAPKAEPVKQARSKPVPTPANEVGHEVAVFRYPRRSVIEAEERRSVLIVLSLLLVCDVLLLLLALLFPSLTLSTVITLLIAFALAIALILIIRIPKTRNLPSKLEISENHLIIDNERYRLSKLSSCRMTPPSSRSGTRRICFEYGTKPIVCRLGPAKKPSGTNRADQYMDRYGELCRMLAYHGFK